MPGPRDSTASSGRDEARALARRCVPSMRIAARHGELAGVPFVAKDNIATTHLADDVRLAHPRRLREPVRGDGHHAPARRRRGARRQDELRRVRDGELERAQRMGSGAQSRRSHARAGRLVRRLRRIRRRRHRPHRARLRDRRLRAPARVVLRHRRREAHLRSREPLRSRRLRLVARSGRCLRRDGARRGASGSRSSPVAIALDATSADCPVDRYSAAATADLQRRRHRSAARVLPGRRSIRASPHAVRCCARAAARARS